MDVHLVGTGPAIESAELALEDVDVTARRTPVDRIDAADFAIVSDVAGSEAFTGANRVALRGDTPWLAVEVGGIGGYSTSDVDASIAGFAPATGCYSCLASRVAANGAGDEGDPSVDRSTVRLAGAIAGRETITLLSGDDSSILGGCIELPWAERSFLPVPGCPACGTNRSRELSRGYEDVPLETALSNAERALDDRVGVVQSVGEIDSFPTPYYLATNADTSAMSDATAAKHAAGTDADWNAAFMKALGEALERYAAGVYRTSEFEHANTATNAVDPGRFVRPENRTLSEGPRYWTRGVELATGEPASIPVELVHFPPPERRIRPAITTGLGLGNSTDEALLSGLYEVVERDATMIAWYSTFEPLELLVSDDGFEALAKRARAEELQVTPLLVTQDVDVPVVAVAVHRETTWPQFAVGSSASLDPTAAARSALAEALQNWMELRAMGRSEAREEEPTLARYADAPDAARSFRSANGQVAADTVGPASPPSGDAELDAVVDRITAAGLDPYAARLTTRDLDVLGFEAVRVLVPSAQPLFTGDPYFGERARAVPGELGFEPQLDRVRHPYP